MSPRTLEKYRNPLAALRASRGIRGPFSWNGRRFVDGAGRVVDPEVVEGAVVRVMQRSSERVTALAERLRAGSVSLKEWQALMAAELKAAHLAAGAAARGGFQNMSPADYGRVGRRLRDEYGWLRGFAEQVASGKQRLDGTLATRAQLYAEAVWTTYHKSRRALASEVGAVEERNVLDAGKQHCAGCLAAAAPGWVPVGTLTAVGTRECGPRCGCRLEYRDEAGNVV